MKLEFPIYFFFSSIFFLSNCNLKSNFKKESVEFFDNNNFISTKNNNILIIEGIFEDCGEWGGHKERIIISRSSKSVYHANYQVYPYNCDSLDFYYSNDSLIPITNQKIIINDKEIVKIKNYIDRLKQAKMVETFPGHAGDIFSIWNSDSTFFLQVIDNKPENVQSFTKLVSELLN